MPITTRVGKNTARAQVLSSHCSTQIKYSTVQNSLYALKSLTNDGRSGGMGWSVVVARVAQGGGGVQKQPLDTSKPPSLACAAPIRCAQTCTC